MQKKGIIDFEIKPLGKISNEFLKRNICSYNQAINYIRNLPYGNNKNKTDLTTIFKDGTGTCSTKHAILKQLSNENNFFQIDLIIGIFRMNGINEPNVYRTLKEYNLDFIPEAHCYLKFDNEIYDFTTTESNAERFIDDILDEIIIQPHHIVEFKTLFHKNYLINWLAENIVLEYTLDEIWEIRKKCIHDFDEKKLVNNFDQYQYLKC